ncbi:MAG TPA: PAS domain S-box protein [Candidatus Bathyarchaeia archaeon]
MKPRRNPKTWDENETRNHVSEMMHALADGINEITYIADPKTCEILFANKKAIELFGKSIAGKKCHTVFYELDAPCPYCQSRENLKARRGFTEEFQNPRNGHWYKRIYNPIKWLGGKYVLAEMAINITEQKKMEESLHKSEMRYRNVVETAPVVIYTLSADGTITSLNPAFERFTGWSCDEWIGKTFTRIVHPDDLPFAVKSLKRTLKGESQPLYQLRILSKSGEYLVGEFASIPMIESGEIVGEFGAVTDVTERKRAEDALRESEDRFRSVVENSPDAIGIIDDNFHIIYANKQSERLFGYSKKELVGHDFRKLLSGHSLSLVQDRYTRRIRGEYPPPHYEIEIRQKNGKVKNVELRSSCIRDRHGKMRTVSQARDITERKRIEEESTRFEERLSALNAHGQSLNIAKSMEEIYKLTLDAAEKTLGYKTAAILVVEGKTLRTVAARGLPNTILCNFQLDGKKGVTVKAARTGKPVFVPDVRKEKAYLDAGLKGNLSELAVPIKRDNEVLGVLNVESDRLAAFDEEDRKLLEILTSHAAIAISNLRRQNQLKKLSEGLEYLMDSTAKIMQTKNMRQRLKAVANAIRNFGWRRVIISLRDQNLEGKALVTVGLTKKENQLLRKRRAPGRVWKERLGPRFERFKIGEFYYLPWSDPWIREHVHKVPHGTSLEDATMRTGVPSRLPREKMVNWHPQDMLYTPLRTPDGKVVGILSMDDPVDGRKPTRDVLIPLELFLHQAAIAIENGQLIDSLRDARKQLEVYAEQLEQKVNERTRELEESQDKLLKTQRLAVIGELAGMVGHDLRNPLTGMAGATYYIKKHLANTDEKISEMIELIEKDVAHSNKIINDLLEYSREIILDLTACTPKAIIADTLSLIRIPKNIKVKDLSQSNPKIKVDAEKLERAFANVVKNAIDAMPNGGTLTIKTKETDGTVKFSFSDTGTGMSKETMKKLWSPLFTTKAKGMGFGLPLCKRIINAHGGTISVKSVPRKGTTFTITIPTLPKTFEKGGEKAWVTTPEYSLLTTTKT